MLFSAWKRLCQIVLRAEKWAINGVLMKFLKNHALLKYVVIAS